MSEILDNIYIWEFLVKSESVLILALVKYMLCSHFTQYCILLYFLEEKNSYFVTKNCWKSSYICAFFLSKKRHNWFHKNLHNSGMVARSGWPDPLLNRIFNALSIGVQYTLSFQWTNFGLKCLLQDTLGKKHKLFYLGRGWVFDQRTFEQTKSAKISHVLWSKPKDWFPYDNGLRHEWFNRKNAHGIYIKDDFLEKTKSILKHKSCFTLRMSISNVFDWYQKPYGKFLLKKKE